METLEVFADVACPFTHVGLRRFVALREELGRSGPVLRVRAWPLEHVNGAALAGSTLAPKVAALRAGVAPDLFTAFDPATFPATSLPALAAEAAAYRAGPQVGQAFSLAVRTALFEQGDDVADPEVLDRLRDATGAPPVTPADEEQVRVDHEEGKARGVQGSPHFFAPDGSGFFCPSLDIGHEGDRLTVAYDEDGFRRFAAVVFS
jgi:predicted DsbA family dithiol-disulfide isomerase